MAKTEKQQQKKALKELNKLVKEYGNEKGYI